MKKRILSLILALSMVLSVLPLGAFAADPPELVMGSNGLPVYSEGTVGHNWVYMNGTLCLLYGTFDFSSTHPQNTSAGTQTAPPVACPIEIQSSYATITGGTFNGTVKNSHGTISDSIFNGEVTNDATIKNSTFAGSVTNGSNIENCTFQGMYKVTNKSTIKNGTFKNTGGVENWSTISGGTFQNGCDVTNYGIIKDNGTFEGTVENSGTIENGTFTCDVINDKAYDVISSSGTINNGTFMGDVINRFNGTIADGTFASGKTVTNYGTINNGTFNGTVDNCGSGRISGGTFAAGLSVKNGSVTGGVFNGVIEGTTGAGVYHITVDEASPDAKIEKVNDVPAVWDPYVVIEPGETKEVTVTASTEIYSLNGKSIGDGNCKSSYGSNNKIVKFTMPGENVVLSTGDLVMAGGYPVGSKNGTVSCEGKGWTYSEKNISNLTGKLTLTSNSGTFDFSLANPQDTTKTTSADSAVACAVVTQSGVEITGGTFHETVTNSGTIKRGTFTGTVINSGTIENGTFASSVTNYGTINSKGTFNGTVENGPDGTISNGTFKGIVTNNAGGEISGGTFKETVINSDGEITGGTFAGSVNNSYGGHISGGVFNLNAKPTVTTGGHNITVASGAKITEVNDVSANWAPYAYAGTIVTITANTEIYSLNGYPINYPKPNDKTTVIFTMPNEDVVLSTGELVMENGYPVGTSGKGWSYDNSTETLTLTSGGMISAPQSL